MPVSIRLDPAIEARLDALALATGRSKTFYIRQAIEEHLADLEDLYLAERRLEDVRSGKEGTVPLADVMARYGLAD